jgi:hypothetical protein
LFHCVVEAVSGTEYPAPGASVNVCTPVPGTVVIVRLSEAVVEVANDCDACVEPLSEVSPPPAPASAPQKNCPVVVE